MKNDTNYDHVGSDEPQNMAGFGEMAVRRNFIRKVEELDFDNFPL